MTMENTILHFRLVLLILVALLLPSCSVIQQAIEKPSVHVQEVSYQPVSLKEGTLNSVMRISNPNGFPLPFRNMTYHLKLNDSEVADTRLSFDKNIPARGSADIRVPIRFQYGELLNGITILLKNREVTYQLSGTLDLGLVEVPFSKTGKFALKY